LPIMRLEASNFKSFEKLDVNLNPFNVIIGANASGKSNFVSIFKFLKDIAESGLDNAISMQGGAEYVRNMNLGTGKDLTIRVHTAPPRATGFPFTVFQNGGPHAPHALAQIEDYSYGFSIGFGKKEEFKITKEALEIRFTIEETDKGSAMTIPPERRLIVTATREGGRFVFSYTPDDLQIPISEILPDYIYRESQGRPFSKRLIIQTPYSFLLSILSESFRDIAIFDLDPRLSKRSTLITGKTQLEPDGSNLAIALKRIIENKRGRERIRSLAKELLPFVDFLVSAG